MRTPTSSASPAREPVVRSDQVPDIPAPTCRRVLRLAIDHDAAALQLPDTSHTLPTAVFLPVPDALYLRLKAVYRTARTLGAVVELPIPGALHAATSAYFDACPGTDPRSWGATQERTRRFTQDCDRLALRFDPTADQITAVWRWAGGDDDGVPRQVCAEPIPAPLLDRHLGVEFTSPIAHRPLSADDGHPVDGPYGVRFLLPVDDAVQLATTPDTAIELIDPEYLTWIRVADDEDLDELMSPQPSYATTSLLWRTYTDQLVQSPLPAAGDVQVLALPQQHTTLPTLRQAAQRLLDHFPEFDDPDQALNGGDAVDRLADCLPALQAAVVADHDTARLPIDLTGELIELAQARAQDLQALADDESEGGELEFAQAQAGAAWACVEAARGLAYTRQPAALEPRPSAVCRPAPASVDFPAMGA